MVVYIDMVKQCLGQTPVSWLIGDEYNVLPTTLETDVLTNMFEGTNRGGLSTYGDDVVTTVIEKPKRKAGVPARFLSRVYAKWDNAPSNVYVNKKSEYFDNSSCCVPRFSDMKKAAKKTDFDYKCFPCRKQDDTARAYTRSYDLIFHMVNTHLKFPNDVRHNTYYAADGTDLRDATSDEIEKYRLAAAHKRKRPETELAPVKSGDKPSTAVRDEKKTANRPSRIETTKYRENSPRIRDKDSGSRGCGVEERGGRTSSRDSRKDRDDGSRSRHRTNLDRGDSKDARERHPSPRGEIRGEDMFEMDEEERDRRMIEEIRRRLEDQKASKEAASGRTDEKDVKTRKSDAKSSHEKESRGDNEEFKKSVAKATRSRRGSKKASDIHLVTMTADAVQREEAAQWASSAASETMVATSKVPVEVLVRSNASLKCMSEKGITANLESEESLFAQEFIAAQYPPIVEGGVSDAIRMGRALVSGALGMQTDDPKLFDATVKLPDCVVVLQSTKKKARTPVFAPPPNSIDSEIDGNDSCEVLLSRPSGVRCNPSSSTVQSWYSRGVGESYARSGGGYEIG